MEMFIIMMLRVLIKTLDKDKDERLGIKKVNILY